MIIMARTKTISMYSFKGYLSNRNPIGIKEIQVFQGNTKVPINGVTFLATTPSMVPTNAGKLIVDGNDETVLFPSTLYWDDRNGFAIHLEFNDYVYTDSLYIRIKSDNINNWLSSFVTYYEEILGTNKWSELSTIYKCKFNGPSTFSDLLPLDSLDPATCTKWENISTPGITLGMNDTDVTFDEVSGVRSVRTTEGLTNGRYYFEIFKPQANNRSIAYGFCSSSFIAGTGKLSKTNSNKTSFGFDSEALYYKADYYFASNNELGLSVPTGTTKYFLHNTIFADSPNSDTIGVYLDLDEGFVTFFNLANKALKLKIKIPWSEPTHFYLGVADAIGDNRRLDVNFGNRPLRILETYRGFSDYDIPTDGLKIGMSSTNTKIVKLARSFNELSLVKPESKELLVNPNYKTDTKRVLLRKPNIVSMGKLKGDDLINYTKIADSYQMVFPIETGLHNTNGVGYIKSTIYKVLGGNNAPIGTVVALVDTATLLVAATTNSDPITGEFEFKYLNMNTKYNIIALDPKLEWVSGIGGPYEAKLMPNAFKDNYSVLTI